MISQYSQVQAHLNPSTTPPTKPRTSATSIPPTPFIFTPAPASNTLNPFRSLLMRTSRKSRRSLLTVSASSKSSDACVSSRWLSSSQWYGRALPCDRAVEESFRKGAESSSVSGARYSSTLGVDVLVGGGRSGDGEKMAAVLSSVSKSSMCFKPSTLNQGGGLMFALLCFLSSSASQSGSGVGKGGFNGCVGP